MKILIIANWKCNPVSLKKAKTLFSSVKRGVKDCKNTEIVICPPFVYLSEIQSLKSNVKLGAQDCFWEEKGAFTAEISFLMLKDLKVEYVIIGHSERRKYFKENAEMINKKIEAVLKAGLKTIVCVADLNQLNKVLKVVKKKRSRNLIIAYEPLFAIGTGKSCTAEKAAEMRKEIKKRLPDKKIPILYGGSVNSQNGADYIKEGGFQGLLIGGVSLAPKEFIKTVKKLALLNS